jgi:hypothetical protein
MTGLHPTLRSESKKAAHEQPFSAQAGWDE